MQHIPAAYLWVKLSQQGSLVTASVFVNDFGHFSEVTLLGEFARFAESLVTETSVTIAHLELAQGETEEVKANIALLLGKRVGNAGLGSLEIQSERCQPWFRSLIEFEQCRSVFVEDHEVVSLANDGWFA